MNTTLNTTPKTLSALGLASLSLLALSGQAGAQSVINPDPALNPVFSTYNSALVSQPNSTVGVPYVGYDPNGGVSLRSLTPATSQSVYEAFTFDSSAAGTFNTLAAGSQVQFQLYGVNNNVNNMGNNPFEIYTTLYAYNPNTVTNPTLGTGTVPEMGPDLFGTPQAVVFGPGDNGGDYSADFNLAGAITAGQKYVVGFTTLSSDPNGQDFGNVSTTVAAQNGIVAGDRAFDNLKYSTDTNDGGNGAGQPLGTGLGGNNTIAFTLDAGAAAPVPEASSLVSTALLLSLGGAAFAFKRRRALADQTAQN